MKLHDLRPADGSRQPRMRVGRGIAAGKGKTAGRGTKGQKARAGGSIPPWFEGGQTPLHMRIPKLHGFKNRFRIEFEVVNVGAIGALAERGAFEGETPGAKGVKAGPITINQDILRAVGLVRTLNKPLKILGAGEVSTPLFVVADAFTGSARSKIEAAGGSVNVLEVPATPLAALGLVVDDEADAAATSVKEAPARAAGKPSRVAASAAAKPDKAAGKPARVSASSAPAKPAKAAKPAAAKPARASVPAEPATDTAPAEGEALSGDDA
jgi:large subunit ribosomal protein L15